MNYDPNDTAAARLEAIDMLVNQLRAETGMSIVDAQEQVADATHGESYADVVRRLRKD